MSFLYFYFVQKNNLIYFHFFFKKNLTIENFHHNRPNPSHLLPSFDGRFIFFTGKTYGLSIFPLQVGRSVGPSWASASWPLLGFSCASPGISWPLLESPGLFWPFTLRQDTWFSCYINIQIIFISQPCYFAHIQFLPGGI